VLRRPIESTVKSVGLNPVQSLPILLDRRTSSDRRDRSVSCPDSDMPSFYSIKLSASCCRVSGTLMPSAAAVLRLIHSSIAITSSAGN